MPPCPVEIDTTFYPDADRDDRFHRKLASLSIGAEANWDRSGKLYIHPYRFWSRRPLVHRKNAKSRMEESRQLAVRAGALRLRRSLFVCVCQSLCRNGSVAALWGCPSDDDSLGLATR